MRWQDFSLKVTPDGQEFETLVFDSPAGTGQSPFKPPYGPDDFELLQNVVQGLGSPEQVGKNLFDALLGEGQVGRRFATSRERASAAGGGLRLRICLDPTKERVSWLYGLPWELLYDGQKFLALDDHFSILRCPDFEKPAEAKWPTLGDRVLVVVSNAGPPLRSEEELRRLIEALQSKPRVKVHRQRATLDNVRHALKTERFQILHFIGHGDVGKLGSQLVFEAKEEGRSHPISGKDLAVLLKQHSVGLAVLNACETGTLPRREHGLDPFSAVAIALLAGEVPAVVAMQHRISDDAAITFSAAFYERLAETDCLDSAVSAGRRELLHLHEIRSLEWIKPVLYSLHLHAGGEAPPLVPPEPDPPEPPTPPHLRRPSWWLPVAALLALATVMLTLLWCRPCRLTRIELDLPGGPKLLPVRGNQRIPLTVDLSKGKYLTGRAVLADNSDCACTWRAGTDVAPELKEINAVEACAFEMNLPRGSSQVYLLLDTEKRPYLFTLQGITPDRRRP